MPQLRTPPKNATEAQSQAWAFLLCYNLTYEEGAEILGFSSKQGLHQWLLKEFRRGSPVDSRVLEKIAEYEANIELE
jgi:hypothetical protein